VSLEITVGSTGTVLAASVIEASSRRAAMRGLLGLPRLRPGQALVLARARQVHTFGMRYAIDVLFCDRAAKVLWVATSLSPWRMSRFVGKASFAVELLAGCADGVRAGDQLSFKVR
jgi:uncharacterized membrane protein (UPF0127 family)